MRYLYAKLAEQPGQTAQQHDAHHHQRHPGHPNQQRPIGNQVGADQPRRRAERDEDRCKAGNEEEGVAQDPKLLPHSGRIRRGHGATAHVGDVGRDQGKEAGRGAGNQPSDKGKRECGDHVPLRQEASSFAWISRPNWSSLTSPGVRATMMPRPSTRTCEGGASTA